MSLTIILATFSEIGRIVMASTINGLTIIVIQSIRKIVANGINGLTISYPIRKENRRKYY